jgi:bisphosphoglycerate-dependent phosphoglycerate mutase
MDNEKIVSLSLPNGAPFVFEFDRDSNVKTTKNYYLENLE